MTDRAPSTLEALELRLARERRARENLEALLAERDRELLEVRRAHSETRAQLEKGAREHTDELRRARTETASLAESTFLSNMSHELRTPMNGILGTASLLLDSELKEGQREMLRTLQQCASGLLRLFNDALGLSRLESRALELSPRVVDLSTLLSEVADGVAPSSGHPVPRLSVDLDPAVHGLYELDDHRLRQVLVHLLGNALQFTQEGEVVLRARSLAVTESIRRVRFEVRDTGIGIPADRLESIFERFHQVDASTTRRCGGTGLGLSISRELVSLMGGRLAVQSQEGLGSTFSFELSLRRRRPEKPAPASAPPSPLPPLPPGLRVLVAEDNAVNQQIVRRMLGKLGVEIELAEDGAQAVERYRAGHYDLVLMDWQMPVLDGLGATQAIRAHEAELEREPTPILALTANAMDGDPHTCLDAGMSAYLSKPITLDRLRNAITAALATPARGPSAAGVG